MRPATGTLTEYQSLLVEHTPRPIVGERDYRRALTMLERLMEPRPSKAKAKLIELLSTLVADYEDNRYPAPNSQPHEVLEHLIEARGVTQADVARATNIPRSTISAVLAGPRKISKTNVTRLADYFRVPPSVFLEAAKKV